MAAATVTKQLEEEMPSPGTTNQGTGDVQCVRGASAKRVHESALGGRPIGWSWPGALAEMRLWSHKVSLLGSQRGRGRPLSWTEVKSPPSSQVEALSPIVAALGGGVLIPQVWGPFEKRKRPEFHSCSHRPRRRLARTRWEGEGPAAQESPCRKQPADPRLWTARCQEMHVWCFSPGLGSFVTGQTH